MEKKLLSIVLLLILSFCSFAQKSSKGKEDYGKSMEIDHVIYMVGSWQDLNLENVDAKTCKTASVLRLVKLGRDSISNITIKGEIQFDDHVFPVIMISNNAFKDCKALETIQIEENITLIGLGAFENCTSLTSILLPKTLEVALSDIFKNCTALRQIIIRSTIPPRIMNAKKFNTFNGIPKNCMIVVPKQSKKLYLRDSDWASLPLVFEDIE